MRAVADIDRSPRPYAGAVVVLGVVVVLGAVATGWLRRDVRKSIYRAPRPADPVCSADGREVLLTGGASPVPVLYRQPPSPGTWTVVYLHGNAENLAGASALVDSLHAAGFGVAAVEYVGYEPGSGRHPSFPRIVQACDEAVRMLRSRPETERVLVLGFSLGTGFATQVAARGLADALVLAAPFTSAGEMVRERLPWVPPRLVLGAECGLDNLTTARAVTVPTLVIHGDADEQLPIAGGRRVAGNFPAGHFIPVAGVDHNGLGDWLLDAVRIAVQPPRDWPSSLPPVLGAGAASPSS